MEEYLKRLSRFGGYELVTVKAGGRSVAACTQPAFKGDACAGFEAQGLYQVRNSGFAEACARRDAAARIVEWAVRHTTRAGAGAVGASAESATASLD